VATGRPSGTDFGAPAQHCVGPRPLLWRRNALKLEILLRDSWRFLIRDNGVLVGCGMAVGKTDMKPLFACVLDFHFDFI